MVIGIKYCGGCNPTYERVARVERFKKDHPEHEYVSSTDRTCDIWMVVCGCSRRCAITTGLKARSEVVPLWNEESFQWLERAISTDGSEGSRA